jgi:hypothetical protein
LTLTPSTVPADAGSSVSIDANFVLPQGDSLHSVRMAMDVARLPVSWKVSGHSVTAGRLPAGRALTGHWQVTLPVDQQAAVVDVPVVVTYGNPAGRGDAIHVEQVVTVTVPPHGSVQVSDLPFVSASNGWGPVERDLSNGETGAGDGKPITLRGTVYPKGLGANAVSDVSVFLGGRCGTFTSTVGIDDEVAASGQGSVTFTVLGDGVQLATTPVIRYADGATQVTADVTGVQKLDLVVGDGGDGPAFDHGDWAAPMLHCG